MQPDAYQGAVRRGFGTEDLADADLGRAFRPVFEADHPQRHHGVWMRAPAGPHLDGTERRSDQPRGGLRFDDGQAIVGSMLPDGRSNGAGEAAGLQRRNSQVGLDVGSPLWLIVGDEELEMSPGEPIPGPGPLAAGPVRQMERDPLRAVELQPVELLVHSQAMVGDGVTERGHGSSTVPTRPAGRLGPTTQAPSGPSNNDRFRRRHGPS